MSRRPALIFITSALGLAAGITLYNRSVTVDSQMKDLSLKPEHQIIRHTAKLTSQVNVQIVNKNENYKPAVDENLFLSASINLQSPTTKVDYQWILPDGLATLPGENLSDQMNVTNWQEPLEIQIQLKNNTLENQKIFIKISASGPNRNDQLASGQYDTQNYLELQQEQSDLMKRQEEYLLNLPDESKKFK